MVLDSMGYSVFLIVLLLTTLLIVGLLAVSNRKVKGLALLALGQCLVSLGVVLALLGPYYPSSLTVLIAMLFVLFGQMWIWLGFSEFWQKRTRVLSYIAKFMTLAGVMGLMHAYFQKDVGPYFQSFMAGASGALSLASAHTIWSVVGGRSGFYKGILKCRSLGTVLALIIFGVLGLYQFSIVFLFSQLLAFQTMVWGVFSSLIACVTLFVILERFKADLRIEQMLDPLTKALNKHAFEEVMKAILARSKRYSEPVSLIMVDIDRFKKINEQYGREVGDKALALLSELITRDRRAQDVFCRFGGEEFVYLLPNTTEEGASLVAAYIKKEIEEASLKPLGVPIKLSVSMGMVTARGDDLDASSMLNLVDRRMHQAQQIKFEQVQTS